MQIKRPVFKDTKKIVKKFQEICDKNKVDKMTTAMAFKLDWDN